MTKCEGSQVVVDKIDKKMFFVDGFELKLCATLQSNRVIDWDSAIAEEVKQRVALLLG